SSRTPGRQPADVLQRLRRHGDARGGGPNPMPANSSHNLPNIELTFYIESRVGRVPGSLDAVGVHPTPGMTPLPSPLDPLDPVLDRWLVGAVAEQSSSEIARAAAAAWLLTYERARALGCDMDGAEARADDAYEWALSGV